MAKRVDRPGRIARAALVAGGLHLAVFSALAWVGARSATTLLEPESVELAQAVEMVEVDEPVLQPIPEAAAVGTSAAAPVVARPRPVAAGPAPLPVQPPAEPEEEAPPASPSVGEGGPTDGAPGGIPDAERNALLAGYVAALEKVVRGAWRPSEVYRRVDPTGALYGPRERRTELDLRVRADGAIDTIAVRRSSGLAALDDEAIAVLRRVTPLPPPPAALLGRAAAAAFSFGFDLDLSGPAFLDTVRRRVAERLRQVALPSAQPVTVVQVDVRPDGSLGTAEVTVTSGNSFVDAAALEAVRAAPPLPPPPRRLLVSPGTASALAPLSIAVVRASGGTEVRVARRRP